MVSIIVPKRHLLTTFLMIIPVKIVAPPRFAQGFIALVSILETQKVVISNTVAIGNKVKFIC